MQETVIQLTNTQKIQILEKAREILGPNGENWTKACWWGVKYSDAEIDERLVEFGYSRGLSKEEIRKIDFDEEGEICRVALADDEPERANVWCLMGALEESAYRLGFIEERDTSERLADPISLRQLVRSKKEWSTWGVIDVNDNPNTTWETIRDLVDERLAQLSEE